MGFPSRINVEKTAYVSSCWSIGQNTTTASAERSQRVGAGAFELGPADTASEETEVEEPKVVTTD